MSSFDNFEIRIELTLQIVTDGKSIVPSACFSSIAEIDVRDWGFRNILRFHRDIVSGMLGPGSNLTSDMRIAEVFDDRFICVHKEIAHCNTENN